jgi:hypothetical protein
MLYSKIQWKLYRQHWLWRWYTFLTRVIVQMFLLLETSVHIDLHSKNTRFPTIRSNDLMVWPVTRRLIASIRSITGPSYKTMVESIFLGAICLFLSFATFFCSKQRKKIISFNFLSFLQSFLRNKHSVNLSFPQSFLQLSLLPGLGLLVSIFYLIFLTNASRY